MKILWHSNSPLTGSGYGVQTAYFTPRLKRLGHDVAISAFYGHEGHVSLWEDDIPIYPTDHTRFGKAMLPFYVGHFAGDGDPRDVQVITLMDVWALTSPAIAKLNIASWVPVDHDPCPPRVKEYFTQTGAQPIAMSGFGYDRLKAEGLDPYYVPHAVDTSVFKPLPDRAEIRRSLHVPEDAFVIGMVANNKGQAPPRKAFPQVFQAFRFFLNEVPDAILYLHSEVFGVDNGINLVALAEKSGIPDENLAVTDQLNLHLGMGQEDMARIYNGFDVLASPSYGEGFGVPLIEAQACGVPVIATAWTSMPELVAAGWLVQGDTWYDPPHGSYYMCPSINEILQCFREAYENRHDSAYRELAVQFAQQYDVERVLEEHWVPVLEQLDAPREVGPLKKKPKMATKIKAGV